MAQSRLEFFEELMAMSRKAIAEAVRPEVDAHQADAQAVRITESFSEPMGGCEIYVPRAEYLQRLRRDREIAQQFTGVEECAVRLVREYGVSTVHVCRIAKQQRAQRQEAKL